MIAALIPGAGLSRRMGRPKLLLDLAGQSLVGRLVDAFRGGGIADVVLVGPPREAEQHPAVAAEAARLGIRLVTPNHQPEDMRGSILLGLEALEPLGPEAFLLCPADSPGVTSAVVERLVHAYDGRPLVASRAGKPGHPLLLPWSWAERIRSLPEGLGVNSLIKGAGDAVGRVECDEPVTDDLDTPEDYARWSGPD